MDPNDPDFATYLAGLEGTPTQRMLVILRTAFNCGAIVGQRREARASLRLMQSAVAMAQTVLAANRSITADIRAQTDRVDALAGFAAGKVGDRN